MATFQRVYWVIAKRPDLAVTITLVTARLKMPKDTSVGSKQPLPAGNHCPRHIYDTYSLVSCHFFVLSLARYSVRCLDFDDPTQAPPT